MWEKEQGLLGRVGQYFPEHRPDVTKVSVHQCDCARARGCVCANAASLQACESVRMSAEERKSGRAHALLSADAQHGGDGRSVGWSVGQSAGRSVVRSCVRAREYVCVQGTRICACMSVRGCARECVRTPIRLSFRVSPVRAPA